MEKLTAQAARELADNSDHIMNDVFSRIGDAARKNLTRIDYSFKDCSGPATKKVVESLKYLGYAVIAPIPGREGEPFASDYIITWWPNN